MLVSQVIWKPSSEITVTVTNTNKHFLWLSRSEESLLYALPFLLMPCVIPRRRPTLFARRIIGSRPGRPAKKGSINLDRGSDLSGTARSSALQSRPRWSIKPLHHLESLVFHFSLQEVYSKMHLKQVIVLTAALFVCSWANGKCN